MAGFKMRKNYSAMRVVGYIFSIILTVLYGQKMINVLAQQAYGECGDLWDGFEILGWQTGNNATAYADLVTTDAYWTYAEYMAEVSTFCQIEGQIVYDVSGSGLLAVVSLALIAGIIFEVIDFK